VVLKKSFYGCSNYPNCTFTLSDQFRKKKLTKTNLKDLLFGKETVVSGIKKADKTTYNAKIKLSDTGQITFVSFVNAPKKAKKVGNKA
jgi:DNA topoisomerase-3